MGRVNVTTALQFLSRWPVDAAVALHRSPQRCSTTFPDCAISEEVDAAISQQYRYRQQARQTRDYIKEQVRAGWSSQGHPIYQGGFVIYNQQHSKAALFQKAWFEHIQSA